MASTSIVVHEAVVARILRSPTGMVARDALRRGHNVRDLARRLVHVDSGRLRSSIFVRLDTTARGLAVRVGSDLDYARYHHDGTGVYGPRGRPIDAGRGRVFIFVGLGGQQVFTRVVRGSPGTHFLERALPAARL